ncbi:putative glycolipid-binding domain-containing protein [Acidovorax sp. SUPP3434]|uniref:putative glycolipid-binding domain-containing protein n=1 Tax=Acidovorax sp. SUPP3434 TaxID=2920880 RepID=UPI0023DE68AB|nr:putative glycolipid-binding domain-containing protein [Acidovorax sp. SUPP3434]GKT00244.1 putative glycolipid-binding domain-containing protein [Acidovorax sp. SUPP3434]
MPIAPASDPTPTPACATPGTSVLFWRGTANASLERLALHVAHDGITASSTVIGLEGGGFQLTHRWRITPDWHTQSVEVERWNANGHRRLALERNGSGWTVDGKPRTDLDGAGEPDLSATPFCNTFPILRTPLSTGKSLRLETAFIDALEWTVTRSRQRYDRLGPRQLRYVDLGLFRGFEALLTVDANGFVERYEGLFERIRPAS